MGGDLSLYSRPGVARFLGSVNEVARSPRFIGSSAGERGCRKYSRSLQALLPILLWRGLLTVSMLQIFGTRFGGRQTLAALELSGRATT